MTFVHKKVMRELMALKKNPPMNVKLVEEAPPDDPRDLKFFTVEIKGIDGTLFEGEEFKLSFKFPDRYPFDPPQVKFVGEISPEHPQVYSNGHICLSILTEDWSPSMCAEAVCVTIISMLSDCVEKKRPVGDVAYVRKYTNESTPPRFDYCTDPLLKSPIVVKNPSSGAHRYDLFDKDWH